MNRDSVRSKCRVCRRWMSRGGVTAATPAVRRRAPHADMCEDCPVRIPCSTRGCPQCRPEWAQAWRWVTMLAFGGGYPGLDLIAGALVLVERLADGRASDAEGLAASLLAGRIGRELQPP